MHVYQNNKSAHRSLSENAEKERVAACTNVGNGWTGLPRDKWMHVPVADILALVRTVPIDHLKTSEYLD
jgi:hypothetical protein